MQMLVPRGKYSFNVYNNYLKLHGKTHDYKILFKDINRAFLLPKPDGAHMVYIISLKTPLRQGQTTHNYVVIQFKKDREEKLSINLSPEEIKEKYGDDLTQEIEGTLYDVLSRLFKTMIKVSIIVPSGFKSDKGAEAVKCSVRANDGFLYPLNKSFLFIHKPVYYIRHEEIVYLEFNRITECATTGRSFDVNIKTKNETMSFTGIEKQELKHLIEYLKSKKIKCRNGDNDGKVMDLESGDFLLDSTGRRANKSMAELDEEESDQPGDADDSDEEDEDFDVNVQEEDSEFEESHGSESLVEESEEDTKKKKGKANGKGKKKTKKEEDSKEEDDDE